MYAHLNIKEGSMLIIKHTVETKASAADIWRLWEDVPHWNTWDYGIEFSTLEGPFKAGTKGTLKPKGGPLVQTELTEVKSKKRFVSESKLFLARIIVSHDMKESKGKTQVTHQIEMTGPLAFFFALVIGRGMKKNLPQDMEALIKKAENLNEAH